PVAAHGDSIQDVGDLHRALLVRDQQDLRMLRESLDESQEPVQVDVVEGRLDLVQEVERTRPRAEDREEERQRREGPLAPREERYALYPLPPRPCFQLDAGREEVGGLGERQLPLATGE